MLTHYRKPVCLSMVSTDLPIWSVVETAATVYQKDQQRFHLLLTEPVVCDISIPGIPSGIDQPEMDHRQNVAQSRLLWLEISPYRAIATMQGNGHFSYRHLWERGMYGISRYWLQNEPSTGNWQMQLRNYTRSLTLVGHPLPELVRLEYELWSANVALGRYILNLEIHH